MEQAVLDLYPNADELEHTCVRRSSAFNVTKNAKMTICFRGLKIAVYLGLSRAPVRVSHSLDKSKFRLMH